MKYMIASDLHGSYQYAEQLLARFEEEKADMLILLGDLLYHGARNPLPEGYSTKDLTALLNRYKSRIFAVRGNCDSEVDQMVLEFPMSADYNMMYVDGRLWILTHGHLFDEHSMIPHEPGAVLLHGHTHVKVMSRLRDESGVFYFVNPGSVSLPKDGPLHSYVTYENRVFSMKNLDGSLVGTMELPEDTDR